MKLALLMGNRFSPWHLAPYRHLGDDTETVLFRGESEIQRYFQERDGKPSPFRIEPVHFDVDAPGWVTRWTARAGVRLGREPRMLPFYERLGGFDVMQSWELFTDWTAEAMEARERFHRPVAVMVWDNLLFNMEQTARRRAIKARVLQEADRFLVHTDRSRRMLRLEGVEPARIAQFAPGVDIQTFSPGPGPRAALGLGEDEFVALFVGWFLPRKGLDFLLMALAEIVQSGVAGAKRLRLVMAGSGPGRDRIEALIARLGIGNHCTFLGSVPYDRMPDVFRCSDVFVLPSIATPEWQEQFAMSLIEAMACGVPCISTLSGAIPEIAGEAAMLVQPNDFSAIEAALRRLMESPALRRESGEAARNRVEACFDVRQTAHALRAVYAGLR